MHIKIEQNMPRIKALGENIAALGDAINAEELKKEVAELDNRTAAPDFWNDAENSQKVLKQLKAKKSLLDGYITLSKSYDDLTTLIDTTVGEGAVVLRTHSIGAEIGPAPELDAREPDLLRDIRELHLAACRASLAWTVLGHERGVPRCDHANLSVLWWSCRA